MSDQVEPLWVSLSAISEYRECPQAYAYRYVDGLRPLVEKIAIDRGRIIHEYYDRYYKHFQQGSESGLLPEDAHVEALKETLAIHQQQIDDSLALAVATNDDKTAIQLERLPAYVARTTQRYFELHGREDVERHVILRAEYPIKMFLTTDRGIITSGKVDLLTFDKETGHVHLWEHKTHADIPEERRRMVDLQTMLYAVQIEAQEASLGQEFKIDSIIWNYTKTVEPTGADGDIDDLFNKPSKSYPNGYPSRDKSIKTCWRIWAPAMEARGLDPNEDAWEAVRQNVLRPELEEWFPRFEQVIIASPHMLLDDYIRDSRRLQQDRREWENGRSKPTRWIGWRCPRCIYYSICTTVACGGSGVDESDAIDLKFRRANRTSA